MSIPEVYLYMNNHIITLMLTLYQKMAIGKK